MGNERRGGDKTEAQTIEDAWRGGDSTSARGHKKGKTEGRENAQIQMQEWVGTGTRRESANTGRKRDTKQY